MLAWPPAALTAGAERESGEGEAEELPPWCVQELAALWAEAEQLEKADLVAWLVEELEHGMQLQLQLDRRGA